MLTICTFHSALFELFILVLFHLCRALLGALNVILNLAWPRCCNEQQGGGGYHSQ